MTKESVLRTLCTIRTRGILVAAALAQSVSAAPILLKSGAINPEAGTIVAAAQTRATANAQADAAIPERGLYLVQCPEAVSAEWHKALEATGAIIRNYIPENAYIVDATADAYRKIVANVPHSYLGEFRPEYRIDESVMQDSAAASTTAAGAKPRTTGDSTEVVEAKTYDILLFEAEDLETVSERISKLGGCEVLPSVGAVIRAKLTADAVLEIASWVEVHWIELNVPKTTDNSIAVDECRLNVRCAWPGGTSSLGLTGSGQIVGVADSGFDTGDTNTVHRDVRGRILRAFARARTDEWSDLNGHGTHVVGSILGNGSESSGEIKGVAYGSELVIQSLGYDSSSSLNSVCPLTRSCPQCRIVY